MSVQAISSAVPPIQPIASAASAQGSAPAPTGNAPAPVSPAATVHISNAAKAGSGDKDHDGDSK